MENSDYSELIQSLSQNYGVDLIRQTGDMSQLKQLLRVALQNLLQNDPERLISVMYRLDINEIQFKKAMQIISLEDRAEALADLVFARELKRLEFRKKYRPPTAE